MYENKEVKNFRCEENVTERRDAKTTNNNSSTNATDIKTKQHQAKHT